MMLIKIIFIALLIPVISLTSPVSAEEPQIIARLNAHALDIHYSETDRAELYAVIDSNQIVLAVDKALYFIENNKLKKKIYSPAHIFAFDVSKQGNGVIVSDGGLYSIRKFLIETKPVKSIIENPQKGQVIWTVDMVNDSIARFIVTGNDVLYYININNFESNNYIINVDETSQFISDFCSSYVGLYENKHYFLEYDIKAKSECLVVRGDLKRGDLGYEKIFKFGDLGRRADESVPIRYDEEANLFYEMLFKNNEMILYKFDIKQFK